MSRHTRNEKECEEQLVRVDITEYSSYLLIPERFVQAISRVGRLHDKNHMFIDYEIERRHLKSHLVYREKVGKNLEFFGLIQANGKIKRKNVRDVKKKDYGFVIQLSNNDHEIIEVINLE